MAPCAGDTAFPIVGGDAATRNERPSELSGVRYIRSCAGLCGRRLWARKRSPTRPNPLLSIHRSMPRPAKLSSELLPRGSTPTSRRCFGIELRLFPLNLRNGRRTNPSVPRLCGRIGKAFQSGAISLVQALGARDRISLLHATTDLRLARIRLVHAKWRFQSGQPLLLLSAAGLVAHPLCYRNATSFELLDA